MGHFFRVAGLAPRAYLGADDLVGNQGMDTEVIELLVFSRHLWVDY